MIWFEKVVTRVTGHFRSLDALLYTRPICRVSEARNVQSPPEAVSLSYVAEEELGLTYRPIRIVTAGEKNVRTVCIVAWQ